MGRGPLAIIDVLINDGITSTISHGHRTRHCVGHKSARLVRHIGDASDLTSKNTALLLTRGRTAEGDRVSQLTSRWPLMVESERPPLVGTQLTARLVLEGGGRSGKDSFATSQRQQHDLSGTFRTCVQEN